MNAKDQALCNFAEKLTGDIENMDETDVADLRNVGFGDRAIHDATQVNAYFNYINRIAEGLGIDYEDFIRAWEESDCH